MSRESKTTFFAKTDTVCPVCGGKFHREELLTGRGRLIAGDLTDELRRTYDPSTKYGEVYPLIYTLVVCPECLFTAFSADFEQIPDAVKEALLADQEKRKAAVMPLFRDLDFRNPRTLKEGAAGYLLGVMSYDLLPKGFSPTIKQGLCALRGAWLLGDLHRKYPGDNWDYLVRLFYRKACFFYTESVVKEGDGQESVAEVPHLGPDLDKNYGYDGVLYLSALLEYRFGPREDLELRRSSLETAKRTVARIFGMGKASKDKPSALLDRAKDLFSKMGEELDSEPEFD